MRAVWNGKYGSESGYNDNETGESVSWGQVQGEYGLGDDDKWKKSEAERYGEIVTINGQKYHKNTGNIFAAIGNKINSLFGGSSTRFVEHESYNPVEERANQEFAINSVGGVGGILLGKGAGLLFRGFAGKAGMTTVGRWMSKSEYEIMAQTGQMVEGAGGQTFVATGGPNAFSAAAKGSVYAEFQVPTNSLLQGGQSGWFKVLGPNAMASQQYMLQKQGGELLPQIQNLTNILLTK